MGSTDASGILSKIGAGLEGLFRPQGNRMSLGQAVVRSATTSVAREVGHAIAKEILRSVTGSVK